MSPDELRAAEARWDACLKEHGGYPPIPPADPFTRIGAPAGG